MAEPIEINALLFDNILQNPLFYLGIALAIVLNGFLGAMGKDVYDMFKEKYGWFKDKIKDKVSRKLKPQ